MCVAALVRFSFHHGLAARLGFWILAACSFVCEIADVRAVAAFSRSSVEMSVFISIKVSSVLW